MTNDAEIREGWQEEMPNGQKVAHYFRGTESLCGKMGFFFGTVIDGGIDAKAGPGDCAACTKKVTAERAKITWDADNERGVARDGTVYHIQSEQGRGEPRMYWVMDMTNQTIESESNREVMDFVADGWPTLPKVKKACERHALAKVTK